MRVAVIGLGKIGLPLAIQYASKGCTVTGVDTDRRVVTLVNQGLEPFPGEAYLRERLMEAVAARRLSATADYAEAIPGTDVIVVVVPLFVDNDGSPDYTIMDSATASIGDKLTAGTLVIYETTLPVGTTRSRWVPALEKRSGLTAERDFNVAFSPERVLTGRVFADLRKYPKIVGGLSDSGTAKAIAFYESVLEFNPREDLQRANGVWNVGSTEAAELTKLAETTYRDVNIALANQFALFARRNDIDIYAVIAAANSQPYSRIHQPGIAVGGHCIPIYPQLYLSNDPTATVVAAARSTNADMPLRAIELLERDYGDLRGSRTAILGAAYRGGVKETAFSGVYPLAHQLNRRGVHVTVHDPMYSPAEIAALGFTPYTYGDALDIAILQANHPEYFELRKEDFPEMTVVLDGRNVLTKVPPGVTVLTLGTPHRGIRHNPLDAN